MSAKPQERWLLDALFFAHVREGALVKQQAAAMRSLRAHPTERHLLWVVASLLAQARAGSGCGDAVAHAQATQLLSLGEGMMKRWSEKGELRTQASLLLYVAVLQGLGRTADALALAQSPLADRCVALGSDRQRLTAELAAACGDWPSALYACRELLSDNADDWLAFLGACDAQQALKGVPPVQAGPPDAEDAAAALAALEALAARLLAQGEAAGGARSVGRGPWLAQVEVAHRRLRLCGHDDAASSASRLSDAIVAHWRSFGDAPCAAADLARYARALRPHPEAAGALSRALDAAEEQGEEQQSPPAESEEARRRNAERRLRATAAAVALRADCGALETLAPAQALAFAVRLAGRARAHGQGGTNGAAATDLREGTPADGAYLLACEALALSALSSQHSPDAHDGGAAASKAGALLGALVLAQEGLTASPYAFPLRLACASLLGLLGCSDAHAATVQPLQLRHVQHESLAHLVQPPLLCGGSSPEAFARAAQAHAELHAAHVGPGGGAGDMAVAAHAAGAADKALEFDAFALRLSRSHARAQCGLEGALQAALGAGEAAAGGGVGRSAAEAYRCVAAAAEAVRSLACPAALASLRFNADLAVNPRFLPPPLAGWHSSVADWWARPEAHAWPGRSAEPAGEGGGAPQRRRSAAALAARWAPLAALAAAHRGGGGGGGGDGGAEAALLELQALASEAASAPSTACSLASDEVLRAGVLAARDVAAACASGCGPEADGLAAGALRALSSALSAAAADAATRLARAAWPPGEAASLPLGGGALNAATGATCEACGFAHALLLAWSALAARKVPSAMGAMLALAQALEESAAALAEALRAATLAASAESQTAALCAHLAALPAAAAAPAAARDAVVEALVGSHRAAATHLHAHASALAAAAGKHKARLGKLCN